jgi:hypothetical protein
VLPIVPIHLRVPPNSVFNSSKDLSAILYRAAWNIQQLPDFHVAHFKKVVQQNGLAFVFGSCAARRNQLRL